MIGASSSGKRFAPLARYLASGRSGREQERVAWTKGHNLPSDDPQLAARIMQATAQQNGRIAEPVYHVVISFDPRDAEKATRELMQRVADRLLADLKLTEHQVMIVAHRDRAHHHVHLMVNRVHPETGAVWNRWRDQVEIQKSLREQERALGLTQVRGRLYQLPGQGTPERPSLTNGELRQVARGEQPFAQWAQQRRTDLREAASWADLHARLAVHGLRVERKGQGLVITDGEREIKASRIARDLSFKQLETRLGPFAAVERAPSRAIERALEQVRSADRATQARDAVYHAEQTVAAARAKLDQLDWWGRRVHALSAEADRVFAQVYRDPVSARQQLDRLVSSQGQAAAERTLVERPDTFGALALTGERNRWGMIRFTDRVARSHLPAAIQAGRELAEARGRLTALVPGAPDGATYAEAIAGARDHVEQATRQMGRARDARASLPTDATIQRSLSRVVGTLAPAELRQLYAILTQPQRALVRSATRTLRDLVLDREGRAYS